MPSELPDLFGEMSQQVRTELLRIGVEESHAQGVYLFHAGDPALCLYVLLEGRVRLSAGPEGRLAHILRDAGDIIGWSSMVGNKAYSASAECLSPVKLTRFEADQLSQILEASPSSGLVFFRRLAKYIGKRLVESYGGILSLQGKSSSHPYGYGG